MATGDKKLIQITGRVIDRKAKRGLSNLRVEAWDNDLIVKNAVGSAATDQQGAFVIEVSKAQLNDLFANRHCVLFFKVFHDGQLITSTEASALWDRDAQDSEIVIKVTLDTPPPVDTGQAFTVVGQVRHADGSVFTDGIVRAFVAIQGPERLLGETSTDANGQFEIAYTLDESQVSQLANVRVLVRVVDSQKNQLAESPAFIPDTTVTVNLTVPNPPPPPDESLSLRGRIRNKDGNPVAGAIVRAFIASSEKVTPIGEARTDSTGSYVITATVQSLTTQPADARLEARVFDMKNTMVGASSSPVQERVSTMDVVADFPDPGKEWCAVSGQVFQKNGQPLGSGIVRVYGAFPSERTLANAMATITAGYDGRFRIEYQPAEFSPRISEANRVEVRVFRLVNNQEQELVQSPSSPVQFRADEEQFLDIHLGDDVDVHPPDPPKTLKVSGLITEDHAPLPDAIVRAFDKDVSGTLLGATQSSHQTSDKGHYEITYTVAPVPPSDISHDPDLLIAVFTVVNNQETLRKTSAVVPSGGKDQTIDVDIPVIVVPPDPGGDITYTVVGTVISPDSAGVNGLRVQIVDKNVGPDVFLAQTVTNEDGSYKVSFVATSLAKRCKQKPDLQSRAYAGDFFLAASEVRYYANTLETLNITLPANSSALASEWETLTGAIALHCGGNLSDLKESADRQDITYLANKTGWDARAVALAALADQFSQRASSTALPPFLFYALFRAGLPTDEDTIYHADMGTLTTVWNAAVAQRVIPKSASGMIPQAITEFQTVSAQKSLTAPAQVGASSLKDMLIASGLNSGQQTKFAELYAANQTDIATFWDAVSKSTLFDANTAKRLQVNGKLGFLTINNASLMNAIHTAAGGITDPLQLAQLGYHNASKWNDRLTSGIPLPPEIPGDTSDARRTNYAEYLGAQVRLSYPTACVAQMVKSGELPMGVPPATSGAVHDFLTAHQDNFDIGMQPVQQFINRNNVTVLPDTVKQVARLQRVLQITPGDQAMTGLMKNGIDAAYHVVGFEKDEFIQLYQKDVGGPESAAQIYDKSVQVHNAALNIAISYLSAANGIALGAPPLQSTASDAPGLVIQPSPRGPIAGNAADVIAYPTLEGLFGEMDFCACDHCRSVLSPAAYLVDLLLFLDRSDQAWTSYVANWRSSHGNAPYSFASQAAWNAAGNPGGTEITPLQVLLSRRPDLQHLPLSCENTNTALPYIDVVNETLEYFIANQSPPFSLTGYVGHDTDGSESADLMASPQFVMDSAYTILRGESFPIPLPFHQPLETLRRYFEKFDVPLPLAMERFRENNDPERGTTNAYGWRDILMEELRLSRGEHEILTDSNAVPLWRTFGFPSGTTDAIAIAGLSNAKFFTRSVEITYEEIVAILKTRFVNPNSDLIPKLERLGVPFAELKKLKDTDTPAANAAFDALLPTGAGAPDPTVYGGDIKAWVRNDANFSRIMELITLTDPGPSPDPCSFDNLEFRFSRPATSPTDTLLHGVEFVRLLRFIRLWKKLGWTIAQTDAAICALFPLPPFPLGASAVDDIDKLHAGFRILLPQLGIVVRVMKALNLTPKRDLLSLLACWSDIGTHGESALYRQMFLNPALLKQDAVFADNGYGEFLVNGSEKVLQHTEALRSAFNLTGDELGSIAAALGYNADTALSVANISAIFRHGYLARKLKISVRELLLLISLTGLDPFAAQDLTNPAILQLIALIQAMKGRSLKSAAALYLIWNQDLSGKSAPASTQVTEFARTLRSDLNGIEDQFAATEDPGGDIARARMALVYGQEASDAFFALLDDTLTVDVAYTHLSPPPPATPALEEAITNADPKLSYDDFKHRLSHAGLLTAAMQTRLNVPGVSVDFQKAVYALFARSEDIKGSFFARHSELSPLYNDYIASTDAIDKKRSALLAAFHPELSRRRKRQQSLQRFSAAAGIELTSAQVLLDPAGNEYPLHAAGHPDQPALNDVLAVETPGLATQFFFRDTATGTLDLSVPVVANLDYSVNGANSLPTNPTPGAAISGIWSGQVETPEAGFYNFIIETDGAAVTLKLDKQIRPLTQNGNIYRNTDPLELKAGVLYDLELTVEKVKGSLSVKWETPKRAREVIPSRFLYPPTILAPFTDVYVRFLKMASLAVSVGLTAAEIAHFAIDPDYQISGDGWLNILPVSGDAPAPIAKALLKPLRDLLDYARIKAEISPGDEKLLKVLEDPTGATASPDSSLFTLTRSDRNSLDDLLAQFGWNIPGLTHFDKFRRVYDALALIQKTGISAAALIKAATNEPAGDTVRDFQAALRARYDVAAWRDVVQPINDTMRSKQRDALVAYILHRMRSDAATAHIDTADKLFEYFLMDVQMEPCMQTSRIRHALSSVQLFIERCLMNLEPRVYSGAINAKQWEWMKRYRVWEANRKVFLFPENWLEPELRDDKSPLFKEIESELLQSDITEDSAAEALLNYLSKLEEIAKLEPCGIYHMPADQAMRTGEIDHVIARTAGAHRKYYYRRFEFGYWTPWEQIKLDIEDNPVIPYVWNGRLLLFWLRILKQASLDPTKISSLPGPKNDVGVERGLASATLSDVKQSAKNDAATNTKLTVQAILCWSEYYNGKWQTAKTSNVQHPATLGAFDAAGHNPFDRSSLYLSVRESADTLWIDLSYPGLGTSFHFYNTHSLPVILADEPPVPGSFNGLVLFKPPDSRVLDVNHASSNPGQFVNNYYRGSLQLLNFPQPLQRIVLKSTHRFKLVEPRHYLQKPWDAPFFYEDSRHVFLVTTAEQSVRIYDGFSYGFPFNPGLITSAQIPPLFFQTEPPQKIGAQVLSETNLHSFDVSIVNPGAIRPFVTEDAYVHVGLGTTGEVRYGNSLIGPAGAIPGAGGQTTG